MRTILISFLLSGFAFGLQSPPQAGNAPAEHYQYFRVGNSADRQTQPQSGTALMGGGSDLDEAFAWLCGRAHGGDFLVIRATGTDAYNAYIQDLKGCSLNSVATLVIPNRAAANAPFIAKTIRQAEAIFISGGDQANYIKYWQHSPVQDAINDQVARGVPIGGTSAGLAVLTDFVFTALNDSAYSKESLADPYTKTITLGRNFIHIPLLAGTISDQHFKKRDRFGRLVVFLARILQDHMTDSIKGIAVDEGNALLMDENGKITLVGAGTAYFIQPKTKPEVCKPGTPLTFKDLSVYRIDHSGNFDVKSWQGTGGTPYRVSAINGVLQSSLPSGSVY